MTASIPVVRQPAAFGVWHLSPLVGLTPGAFLQFTIGTVATAVIFTWTFTNARGSLLLVMLLHASINASGILLQLVRVPLAEQSQLLAIRSLVWIAVALLIIGATRGRLSYQRTET